MPNTAKLLDLCRAEFDSKNWTYDALSEKSAVARSTAVNYITGKVETPKRNIVEALARALGIDPDAPEQKEETAQAYTHCDRCRAMQDEHNRRLREDFNIRHDELRKVYEDRIKEIKEAHAEEIKKHDDLYAQRHEMHEAEKRDMRRRDRNKTIALCVLGAVICAALLIDLLHGGVGWIRYALGGSNHGIIDQAIRFVASFLA